MQELSLGLVMQFFNGVTSVDREDTLPGIVAAPPYVVVHALAVGSVMQSFKGFTVPGKVVAPL